MKARGRVVIIGAGFAGLAATEALKDEPVDVLVLDHHNYNTFQPLLYQVATAGLNPGDIAFPVRSYVRKHPNVSFRQAEVTSVDLEHESVGTADGESIPFDYLVIGCGAAISFFGVPGAAENALAIYTMEDAVAVRNRLASELEDSAAGRGNGGSLKVVIVGGGPTGVEMAGTLAELRRLEVEKLYRELDPGVASVVLIEQQDRLLNGFAESQARYAMRVLKDRGVEVRLGETVAEIMPSQVRLASGEVINCGTVIWTAGVGPSDLASSLDVPKSKGRLAVEDDLRLCGSANVFAVGDAAAGRSRGGAAILPQLAQPAIQQGRHAGRQVKRLVHGEPTVAFCYHDHGIMATIGRRAAVAELPGGIKLRGTLAWLAWLGLHLVFLLGARNRAVVLLNWAWRYVSWRSNPKVLAGV